jgi:hypothetical protein
VIGAVDGERAQVMGERLLDQVQAQRIRRVILDLTGVTAMYGGSAIHRTIVEMIRRAVDILSPGKLVLDAYKTRDEALAWIAARRGTPLV